MRAETADLIVRGRARQTLRDVPELARSLRKEAGLTLKEVGEALGVTHATVQRWETGQRIPRGEMAPAYLAFLRRAAGEEVSP